MRGPRTQADRSLYRSEMQKIIKQSKGLDVIEGEAIDILLSSDSVKGICLHDQEVLAKSVVITTGTFLNGLFI